jgi:hypothetical protein
MIAYRGDGQQRMQMGIKGSGESAERHSRWGRGATEGMQMHKQMCRLAQMCMQMCMQMQMQMQM